MLTPSVPPVAHLVWQIAVGQRVTAFHPKDRHIATGTVLTPDDDHYRVQFDNPKQGVQPVKDMQLMPLLDGSRGKDFTSPYGNLQMTATHWKDAAGGWDGDSEDGVRRLGGGMSVAAMSAAAATASTRAEPKELQLLAFTLRLLDRKRVVMDELKKVRGDGSGTGGVQTLCAALDAPSLPSSDPRPRAEGSHAVPCKLGRSAARRSGSCSAFSAWRSLP